MRRLSIGLALTLAAGLATVAEARIGATEAELMARFGDVVARMPERMMEQGRVCQLGERIVLKRAEWRVTAVLIDARCAKITYAKAGAWTGKHYADLLSVNAGRWAWSEIASDAANWQRTWRRTDGLVAKWTYAGGFAIEAQSFVDARQRLRELARSEVPATSR